MGEALSWIGRAHRGLRGDHLTAVGKDQNPKRKRRAEATAKDGWDAAILFRDAKARGAPAENSRNLCHCRAAPACRPIAF